MKVIIGNYTIHSDQYCMWITEKYQGEDKEGKPKKQERRVAGYSPNFSLLMESFVKNKVLSSDAKTVVELIADLEQVQKDMLKFHNEAVVKFKSKWF